MRFRATRYFVTASITLAIVITAILSIILAARTVNAESPSDIVIDRYVTDYAGVLSSAEVTELEQTLAYIDETDTAQIAIVIVNNLSGQDIEGFAHTVAEGRLGSAEKDNGLLILVSVEDRKYRFEVGRGLEPYLNDAFVGRIGRETLVPAFREGRKMAAKDAIRARISTPRSSPRRCCAAAEVEEASEEAVGSEGVLVVAVVSGAVAPQEDGDTHARFQENMLRQTHIDETKDNRSAAAVPAVRYRDGQGDKRRCDDRHLRNVPWHVARRQGDRTLALAKQRKQ